MNRNELESAYERVIAAVRDGQLRFKAAQSLDGDEHGG